MSPEHFVLPVSSKVCCNEHLLQPRPGSSESIMTLTHKTSTGTEEKTRRVPTTDIMRCIVRHQLI